MIRNVRHTTEYLRASIGVCNIESNGDAPLLTSIINGLWAIGMPNIDKDL